MEPESFSKTLDSIKLGGFPWFFFCATGFNLCICHTDICLCSFDEQTRQKTDTTKNNKKKKNIMDLQTWTYIIVGVTFALYIEFWSRAGSTKILCCRREISPLANGMATAADWMSAASFISMASFPLMAMMVPFI
jgi:hypothetical protein